MKYTFNILMVCCCMAAMVIATGCRIPRAPIRQTVDYAGEFTVGADRVRHFRARDYTKLDTSEKIIKLEYLPIDIFAVLDSRDSVRLYVISAWQEYVWRIAERLPSVDRQYYAPTPLAIQPGGDTAVIVWGYPSIEGRDRDLRDADKRRNNYWSIDITKPAKIPDEVWAGNVQSFPQYGNVKYDPLNRFTPGGPYERAMGDSSWVLRRMYKELNDALGNPDTNAGTR